MISPRQILLFTEEQLTFLQVDSHANPIHPQERDLERRIRDTSGRRCLEQFERFNRPGLWAKTFAGLLIGMEGWFSMKCRLTWKLKATKSHRFYFQLVPSTLPIEETEFGSLPTMLPTPQASDFVSIVQEKNYSLRHLEHNSGWTNKMLPTPLAQAREQKSFDKYDERMQRLVEKGHKPFTMPLDQMALRGLLPTPMASDSPEKNTGKRNQNGLQKMARNQMLPTPTVSDMNPGRRGNAPREGHNPMTNSLKDAINYQEQTSKCSQLSPQFVMEMMGFPTDWTELPFLNGETNQSKQEETQ